VIQIAIVHNGVDWGTVDVASGLAFGLASRGVDVVECASARAVARPDVVIVVAPTRPAGLIETLLKAGHCVTALFTESPYEDAAERAIARQVAGCWTHERASLPAFQSVTDRVAYLPHAWHPAVHTSTPHPFDAALPAHDVVFVGGGVRERITFFNAIDWTGIDLGLYGIWRNLGLKPAVEACIQSEGPISNLLAAALYRRARIGLNLYRRLPSHLVPDRPEHWVTAESLNPRAYELAACGCFQLSERRAEVYEVFGSLVPTVGEEPEQDIRRWLRWATLRGSADAADLREMVAGHSWVDRVAQVLADLRAWTLADVPANLLP
jgi:spore maturation protein CgeB